MYLERGRTITLPEPLPADADESIGAGEPVAEESVSGVPALDEHPPVPPKRRRRIGWIIAVIVLSLALIGAGVMLYLTLEKLGEAQDEIEHQKELIDKKETFSQSAQELMSTAAQFDGSPYGDIVDSEYYASIIRRGWSHRWNLDTLDRDIDNANSAQQKLAGVLTAAKEQAASNSSGTFLESITDQLGSGYVSTSLDTADSSCEKDVLGCVVGMNPYTIHYDASELNSAPYMSDWLRSGLAYHEYAHVLQYTNPEATDDAAKAFGDDWETMADCYALTYLPGWTLDHTIWVSDYEYWEVSLGYGYTCDESQRQVVRDWVGALGYSHAPISQ